MLLFVYQSPYDPVIRVAKQNEEKLHGAIFLSLNEILNEAVIYDTITPKKTEVSWKIRDKPKISNTEDFFLINRAFHCDKSLFHDFIPNDQEYAQHEFYSYLMFAINAFPRLSEPSGYASLCSGVYPLPTQWKKVQQIIPSINTPSYYLGHSTFLPSSLKGTNTVFSQIYQYYHWSPNTLPQSSSIFAFKKPEGAPLLSLNIHDKSTLHPMFNDQMLDLQDELVEEIKQVAQKIHHSFGYYFSETLFFVKGQKISFAMTNNYLTAAERVQGFDALVLNHLLTL